MTELWPNIKKKIFRGNDDDNDFHFFAAPEVVHY